jgi:hypothetical protein
MDNTGKLIAVIGDEDTVTGFVLAGVGQKGVDGCNFLVVNSGMCASPCCPLSAHYPTP